MSLSQPAQQEYDIVANFHRLRKSHKVVNGKLVVWSLQPKVGKQNIIGEGGAKRHRKVLRDVIRKDKYHDLELVWRFVPLPVIRQNDEFQSEEE